VLEDEPPEHRGADLDQIGGRIVGLDQLVHAVGEKRERLLCERIDEKALLRPEQGVDRSRTRAGPLRDRAH